MILRASSNRYSLRTRQAGWARDTRGRIVSKGERLFAWQGVLRSMTTSPLSKSDCFQPRQDHRVSRDL